VTVAGWGRHARRMCGYWRGRRVWRRPAHTPPHADDSANRWDQGERKNGRACKETTLCDRPALSRNRQTGASGLPPPQVLAPSRCRGMHREPAAEKLDFSLPTARGNVCVTHGGQALVGGGPGRHSSAVEDPGHDRPVAEARCPRRYRKARRARHACPARPDSRTIRESRS